MPSSEPRLSIRAIDSVHLFVRDLSRSREHYVEWLGFRQAGLSGAELQAEQGLRASMLESGDARVVLMTPLSAESQLEAFLTARGPGIGRVVLEVDDTDAARRLLVQRGARLHAEPQTRKVGLGSVRWFDVATPLASLDLRFIQYQDCRHVMPGLICRAPRKTSHGAFGVGSLRGVGLCCEDRELGVRYLRDVLGFTPVDGERSLLRDVGSRVELSIESTSSAESLTLHVARLADSSAAMGAAGAKLQRFGGLLRVDGPLDGRALTINLREADVAGAERAA